jgi:hypothetical protein
VTEAGSVAEVMKKARQLLDTTRRGLAMLTGTDPTARPMGIHKSRYSGGR